MVSTTDVAVIGAGVIGTAVAWRCAQRGLSVVVVDPWPERGAWHTAAGMLAPITELHYTETPLLRLNLASLAAYPAFIAELTQLTGRSTGYLECGTISVAWDAADLAALRDLHTFGASLGLRGHLLTGRELRALEPALAPGLPGGLLADEDHQVDPRLLHAALRAAATALGVQFRAAAADPDRASRLILGTGGAPSLDVVDAALAASGAALCTVAMRRVDPGTHGSILDIIDRHGVRLLPNTAGCSRPAAPRSCRSAHPSAPASASATRTTSS